MDKNIPRNIATDEFGWYTCPSCRNIYNLIDRGQEKCKCCGQIFKWDKEND